MLKSMLLIAYLSGASLDVATTCSALNQGFVEGNPIYGSGAGCGRVAVIKAATTSGLVYLVETKVKTKKSKVISYALLAGVSAIPVVLNTRTINRR